MAKINTTAATSQKKTTSDTRAIAENAKSGMFKNNASKDSTAKSSTSLYDSSKNTSGTESKNTTPTKSATKSSSKNQKTLVDLFEAELKDIYSAEKQLVEALPKMVEAAHSEDLKDAFSSHLQQTRRHVERIEKVFDRLRMKHEEEKCEAMEGLIKENEKVIEEFEEGHVRDSAMIIGAQKVEHYEIASYGSICELADVLGYTKIADFLGRTLDEEERTDRILSMIAQDVNDDAYEMSESEEEHEEVY